MTWEFMLVCRSNEDYVKFDEEQGLNRNTLLVLHAEARNWEAQAASLFLQPSLPGRHIV